MSPLLIKWGLRVALAVALAGTLWHAGRWLARRIGPAAADPGAGRRALAALGGALRALVSPRLARVLGALVADVVGGRRLVARDPVRGAAHLAIAAGVTGLVVLHALHAVVTDKLFKGAASTLSPWLWLRDLLGLLVLAGLVAGALRRRAGRRALPPVRRRDPLFVALVVVVVGSGFALGAAKIVSAPAFERMAKEYSSASGAELQPLRAVWAAEYGVVFDAAPGRPDAAALAAGRTLNEESCTGCHARPRTAFVSYPLSTALRPVAAPLARAGAERGLLHLHLLACLLGLAYLPFGRLFHVVADPVSLLARAGARAPDAASRATRRALALDACVRCGLCDERCSVRGLAALLDNEQVLPAAKLLGMRRDADDLAARAEGAYSCTACGRCTRGCPVGLDLDDLWAAGKADLAARGQPAAAARVKAVPAARWAELLAAAPAARPLATTALTTDRRTFSPCVQCQTCTNVCPVVAHSAGPGGVDATPQKVMNLLRLGLDELALGSRMVWDCATCYQCQEHCPAGIRVTDVLYELRHRAHAVLGRRAGLDAGGAP
ncbi:MAG TPA: 4Fe-4S dicluster domain-containing protein [Polyangia bacterium]